MKNDLGSNKGKAGGESSDDDISLAWQPVANSQRQVKQQVLEGADQRADSSDLGVHDDEQPGSIRFRDPEPIRRNWSKIGIRLFWTLMILLVFFGALTFTLRFNKKFRIAVVGQGIRASSYLNEQGFVDASKLVQKISYSILKIAPKKQKVSSKGDRLTGCAATIETLLDKKLKNSFTGLDYYNLGSCLLLSDRYELAKEYIKLDVARIAPVNSWSDDALNLNIISLEVYRRMDAFSFRAPLFTKHCVVWRYDPNCFLRLVEEARQPIRLETEQGFLALEKKLVKETPALAGWLYFVGGIIASKNGDESLAEQRFGKAIVATRTFQDKYLQRELFKSRIKNLWSGKKFKEIEIAWAQLPAEIYSEDSRVFLDVEFLKSISLPHADIKNLTAVYLDRPESYLRFNDDINFLKLILYLGLKSKEFSRVYGFLKNIESQSIKAASQEKNDYWLKIGMVRALYPQGELTKIQEIIATLKEENGNRAELEHLIGLIRLKSRKEKNSLSLASDNFRRAISFGSSNDSSFSLIICQLEMNDLKGAQETYKSWVSSRKEGVDEIWIQFTKGLIIYAGGKHDQAIKVWNELQHKRKSHQFIQVLMHNLQDDPEYMQGRIYEVLTQILPVESPLGALALFSQKA